VNFSRDKSQIRGVSRFTSRGHALTIGRVKLSAKSDYATRAVLGLSRHFPSGAAQRVETLAREQGITAKYLVQILIDLKSASIVRSQRGKVGGYLLARPPRSITLGEVLRCVHGPLLETSALADPLCPVELKHAWRSLQHALEQAANGITFQQLLEQGEAKDKMYYI